MHQVAYAYRERITDCGVVWHSPATQFTKYLTIYRKFIVRSTYDSELKSAKNLFQEYRKLICEQCLRRNHNFASES